MAREGELAKSLEHWFRRSARDLPWRRRRDGYTALVAETMLQQTQVARVLEHYEAFLARFPTVEDLAAADEQEVLAAWQGLGYYRRARHLHAAARMIVLELDGRVPDSVDVLRRLPGVGRYTAGAIASIVYGRPAPIVDGNVQRVLARLAADAGPPRAPAVVRRSWERAQALVAAARSPGAFNEALMELGATVCTPRAPNCDACPVAAHCRARRRGLQDRIPPPKAAALRTAVHHHALVITRGDKLLLEQRPPEGLWARMWQTPTVEAARPLRPGEIIARMPFRVTSVTRLAEFEHQTTHRRVCFHVYAARTRVRRGTWRAPSALGDLPMSNAQRRVLVEALPPEFRRSPSRPCPSPAPPPSRTGS